MSLFAYNFEISIALFTLSGGIVFYIIQGIEGTVIYSEVSLLVLVIINFLFLCSLSSLKDFINVIKTRIENWIFEEYINLDERIVVHKEGLGKLEKK